MIEANLLSVLLYTFGIILLIVLIILGIKLIYLVDKADKILDNVNEKVNSLNSFFAVFDRVNETLTKVTDTVIYSVVSTVSRIFGNKKKGEDENE